MLLKTSEIIGQRVAAVDGEIGKIKDIYFDDISWVIRYFVVSLGTWPSKHDVLLIPSVIQNLDRHGNIVQTSLSRQQIEASPPAESDIPVSRQYEIRLHSYYGWVQYWTYPAMAGLGLYAYPYPTAPAKDDVSTQLRQWDDKKLEESNPHLRSASEVIGYSIKAVDGELGHIEDLLFDSETTLRVTHLVADTMNWWPSKSVVIDTATVREINWIDKNIEVSIDRSTVKGAPEYDKDKIIDANYQTRISAYFQGLSASKIDV